MYGLEYPSIENLVEWPAAFGDGSFYAFNKIALISLLGVVLPSLLFHFSGKELVPAGLQNVTEGLIEFIENEVIIPAIGPDGLRFLPLLMSLFMFVFIGNITEVVPFFNMPGNARMANPLVLAIIVMGVFTFLGFKHNGFSYFKDLAWPHAVPIALRPLVGFIELLSTFILRPFSLAVRLFANMLAGHILLVTFGALTIAVATGIMWLLVPLTFGMLVIFTAFEVFVSFLQAFVFALLTAVYIDSSLHPAH